MVWTVPNTLTVLRIALIPVLVLVFYLPFPWSNLASTAVFGLAALTDWFDGYLARKLGQSSPFGAFLDPVADKLIVAVALVMLVQANPKWWFVIPAAVIVGREIAISALREWMAKIGKAKSVAVAFIGKIKTVGQMVAIPLLLYHDQLWGTVNCQVLGTVLINVAAVLTVISMMYYLRQALPHASEAG